MQRYSLITEKFPREFLLLQGTGCRWAKCTFCDYHTDANQSPFETNKKVLEQVTGVYGVLDIKQARISEYPYEIYLEEMAGRIAHVHVSDIDENGKICLPGRGRFDFDTLVKRLKDVGFDGALIVEVYTDNYEKAEELKAACDFLEEILYKNACLNG